MKEYSEYIKKILSRISSLIIADSVSLILMVLFSILFGRVFGKEIFGIFSLSFIFLTIFRTLIDLGFDYSIPRAISTIPESINKEIIQSLFIKQYIFIILIPFSIIISLFTPLSYSFFILFLSLYPSSFSSTLRAVLRGLSDMKTIARIDTIANLIFYSIAGVAVLLKFELWLIFLFFFVFEWVRTLCYFSNLKTKIIINFNILLLFFLPISIYKKELNYEGNKSINIVSLITNQLNLFLINLLSVLHFRFSSILLGIMSNPIAVGEFTAGLRFLTALRVIPGAILNTLIPDFSSSTTNKKNTKVYLFLVLFILGLLISFLLWLIATPLMMFTFGFESSIPVLKILAWGFVFAVLSFYCEAYLISNKKEKYVNISLIIALFAILVTSLIFIPKYGAVGGAISAIIGELFLLLSYIFFIGRLKMLNLKKVKE